MRNPDATMTTGEAAESIGWDEAVGMPSLGQAASGLAGAVGQGAAVVGEPTRLGVELIRIASGRSDLAPAKGGRRFTDPAWTSNPVFRSAHTAGQLVAGLGRLDHGAFRRLPARA